MVIYFICNDQTSQVLNATEKTQIQLLHRQVVSTPQSIRYSDASGLGQLRKTTVCLFGRKFTAFVAIYSALSKRSSFLHTPVLM